MKSVRVRRTGGPEVLLTEETATPVPGPGQLLMAVDAVGVNFIEIYQREGLYPLPLPFTPGAEAAGRVLGLGPGVTEFAVGDRIVSQAVAGAYAEHALVAAADAVRLPDSIHTATAAAVFLQGLTAHYLATSTYPLAAGMTCLVHAAAGGVGLLLCQMASRRGAHVIGTASSPEKTRLAQDAGASAVINYTTHDFVAEIRRLTDGRGVDVVYDSVGRTTFDGSLDALRPRGMLVLFGQSSGPVPPLDPQVLNRKGSLFLTRPTLKHHVATRDALQQRASDLFQWIASGVLRVLVSERMPLERAADAHRALSARRTTGKLLLVPGAS